MIRKYLIALTPARAGPGSGHSLSPPELDILQLMQIAILPPSLYRAESCITISWSWMWQGPRGHTGASQSEGLSQWPMRGPERDRDIKMSYSPHILPSRDGGPGLGLRLKAPDRVTLNRLRHWIHRPHTMSDPESRTSSPLSLYPCIIPVLPWAWYRPPLATGLACSGWRGLDSGQTESNIPW